MSPTSRSAAVSAMGRRSVVFNLITYGGHQIDGLAAEELATVLKQERMLALAKLRFVEVAPYRTPQTLVGGLRALARRLRSERRDPALERSWHRA